MTNPPLLRGNLVTLRAIDPERDAPTWYHVMKDDEMHRWTGNTVPACPEEINEMLIKYATLEEIIAWSIMDNSTDEMIGTYWIVKPKWQNGILRIDDEAQRMARKCWRKGYTKDARMLVYHYAFKVLGVDEIHAHAWARNISSCRSMESSGHKLVDAQLRLFVKRGKVFCERHYALSRADWEKRNLCQSN